MWKSGVNMGLNISEIMAVNKLKKLGITMVVDMDLNMGVTMIV